MLSQLFMHKVICFPVSTPYKCVECNFLSPCSWFFSATVLNVLCTWTIKTACVLEACPYCVMAVSIDELQQLALKLLQGRLQGDGQSVQGEGQHLEHLWPQQRISWWQYEHDLNISPMLWHLHDYIMDFSSSGYFSAQQVCSVGIAVEDKQLKTNIKRNKSVKQVVKYVSVYSYRDPFAKFPLFFTENVSKHPR